MFSHLFYGHSHFYSLVLLSILFYSNDSHPTILFIESIPSSLLNLLAHHSLEKHTLAFVLLVFAPIIHSLFLATLLNLFEIIIFDLFSPPHAHSNVDSHLSFFACRVITSLIVHFNLVNEVDFDNILIVWMLLKNISSPLH